ncbi:MAG: acyltransferase [Promethearchaeota archaeon]
MKKAFIIPFLFLIFSSTLLILFILSRLFFSIPWINILYDFIRPWMALIFYKYNIYIYGGIVICFVALLPLFVLGYNIAKSNQLLGSIIYIFSLLGYVVIILLASLFTYFSILFNEQLTINTRLMLFLLFLPVNFTITLILFLVNIDFYLFLKDLMKARKVWKHKKPEFEVVEKGKMTYINIETDEFIFTPVPMLIIAKHLQQKRYSIAWFVKGAFNHLFSLVISYLIGWPTARNMLFRFLGMKIGKNCHISQKAIPDPLLPDLIEFEDGSGCGIGVKLLTHNAMNIKHGSFSFGPIKVCKNARIGAYSIILPGVTIGEGSIIGAHSVVAEDIPPYSIALGSPAKVIRELTEAEREEVNKNY